MRVRTRDPRRRPKRTRPKFQIRADWSLRVLDRQQAVIRLFTYELELVLKSCALSIDVTPAWRFIRCLGFPDHCCVHAARMYTIRSLDVFCDARQQCCGSKTFDAAFWPPSLLPPQRTTSVTASPSSSSPGRCVTSAYSLTSALHGCRTGTECCPGVLGLRGNI